MAIEVESEAQKRRSPLVKYSLYISVVLLLIMAVAYALLHFSVNSSEQELADLKTQIDQQMSEEEKELQQEVVQAQQNIERGSQVIDSHQSTYNFLTTLASATHPQLRFDQMDLNTDLKKVTLNGITEDFTTLGQQIKVFQEESSIEKVEIENTSMESGAKVGFKIVLTLNSSIFNFPPQ